MLQTFFSTPKSSNYFKIRFQSSLIYVLKATIENPTEIVIKPKIIMIAKSGSKLEQYFFVNYIRRTDSLCIPN